jgi:hypothetical protein
MTSGCKSIRILRVTFITSLLLSGPITYAAALIGFHLSGSFMSGFVVGGLIMLVCLGSFVSLAVWPCPGCHKRFVRFNAFWPRKCSHCGQAC